MLSDISIRYLKPILMYPAMKIHNTCNRPQVIEFYCTLSFRRLSHSSLCRGNIIP